MMGEMIQGRENINRKKVDIVWRRIDSPDFASLVDLRLRRKEVGETKDF